MRSAWFKLINDKSIKISERKALKIIASLNVTGKRIPGSNMSVWYKDDINEPIILLIGNGY